MNHGLISQAISRPTPSHKGSHFHVDSHLRHCHITKRLTRCMLGLLLDV